MNSILHCNFILHMVLKGSNEFSVCRDDFWNWSRNRCRAKVTFRNQSRNNRCSRHLVRYGTGQAGRFILNDIKKQASDLCAQIVLSQCCSSRISGAGPRNTGVHARCSPIVDILLSAPRSTISAALNPIFSRCRHAIWCLIRSFLHIVPRNLSRCVAQLKWIRGNIIVCVIDH